ncbi:DNA methyltransferase [Pseudoalteromonas sp. MEBiC 03485]|uniref:DNA methyltransferase n=1 Tax=Pseudoalteromonas sp. MEBiC 03485 TaxID=2571103 RepID=UPI00145A00FA|nr:DNA methyltransferase [Pseudoalteromonas sp. MEBiC 03485]
MINNKIERQLEAIDWDFPVRQKGLTSSTHWYPGTFPAQLPSAIIQALCTTDEIVFDPYGGSGTSAAESLRLGRKSWVVDINPIGILNSYLHAALILLKRQSPKKVKYFIDVVHKQLDTTPEGTLVLDFDSTLEKEELRTISLSLSSQMNPKPDELNRSLRKNEPNIQLLGQWVHNDTLEELINLHEKLNSFSDCAFYRLFVEGMISSNLRAICSQNKSWGHIADNCFPKIKVRKKVSVQLGKWLKKLSSNIENTQLIAPKTSSGVQYWCSLHNWNLNDLPANSPETKPTLMVTSPPYGDAIDYIYAQKLSLFYLGYNEVDIQNLCNGEIGARRRRAKANSRTIWAEQLADSALKQADIMGNGLMVTILPHKDHGREIGIKMMTESLQENGWKSIFEMDRSICQKKTRQSWTSIKQETINIFSKE